jgi:hypothetical protein
MAEAQRRGRGERGDEPALGELPRPVAENARRKGLRSDDEARVRRRRCELGLDDRRERQVAQRAPAFPALVALVRENPLGPCFGIELGERREPVDPRRAVAGAPAEIGVGEVVGQDPRLALAEPERAQAAGGVLGAQL